MTGRFWKDAVSTLSLWAEVGGAAMGGPRIAMTSGELGVSDGAVKASRPFIGLVSLSVGPRILKRRDWVQHSGWKWVFCGVGIREAQI